MAEESQESRYEKLVEPEFESSIPQHVLDKLPESDRYLVKMVSVIENKNRWLAEAAIESNSANISLDKRVLKLEGFKQRITSKWSVFAFFGSLLLPVLLKFLLEKIKLMP